MVAERTFGQPRSALVSRLDPPDFDEDSWRQARADEKRRKSRL